MQDLISIIIPVYNRQEFIEECVQSVFAQSHQNFEIIIIDDGSTDNTPTLCKKLADIDSRIVLLQGEHTGVSAARNIGLDAMHGDYVFFLDSDDIIHPLLLEALLSGLKNSDASIAATDLHPTRHTNWNRIQDIINEDIGPAITTYQNHEESLNAIFSYNSPINTIGGAMLKSSLIGNTRFSTEIYIGEDFYFIYQNLIKGSSTVFLKQKWYYNRLHKNNSSFHYDYSSFWTRFYRRKLVWENEENLQRYKYANCEKQQAFIVFLRCIKKQLPSSDNAKMMRQAMKEYKNIILPALPFFKKIYFFISVYMPYAFSAFWNLYEKSRKKRKRKIRS